MNRAPNGRFIHIFQALEAWLPTMMTRAAYYGDPLERMLRIAEAWCFDRGARALQHAEWITADKWEGGPEDQVIRAQMWIERAQVLRETRKKLEDIGD